MDRTQQDQPPRQANEKTPASGASAARVTGTSEVGDGAETIVRRPGERPSPSRCGLPVNSAAHAEIANRERQTTRSPEADVGSDSVGRILSSKYLLKRVLGRGGMGVVFLAEDRAGAEPVAIKLINFDLREQPEVLRALRDEVVQTRKLRHENILGVYALEQDGPDPYIVMEYLEGKTLRALLDEEYVRGMPLGVAWPVIRGIGAALAFAHDKGIVHSDLKPPNVFVTTAGRTKVLDFGIARAIRHRTELADQQTLSLTPAYASCEMLEGARADFSDDVYAFACVVYEILAGKHPFDYREATQARAQSLKPAPLRMLSAAQNKALRRGLAFNRSDRFDSVEEFLQGIEQSHSVPTRKIAAAALGLALATAGAWWATRPTHVVELPHASSEPAPQKATVHETPERPPLSLFRDCDPACPTMVVIPKGSVVVGSPESEPGHRSDEALRSVTFAKPFALSVQPITVREYREFASSTGYSSSGSCIDMTGQAGGKRLRFDSPGFVQSDDDPVVCVSGADIQAFISWINQKAGSTAYRLPSESEWEYAARAGTTTPNPWSLSRTNPCSLGNFGDASYVRAVVGPDAANRVCDDRFRFTSPVGRFPANAWGLYDMIGNVKELTDSCTATASSGFSECRQYRVIRGAAFTTPLEDKYVRFARRSVAAPKFESANDCGFRIARGL